MEAKANAYDVLLDKCRLWLTDFFVPLKEQSDGKPIARSIYLTDLERMIGDIQHLLDLRDKA
jgi:uncharacterized membrane protein YccC